MGFGPSAIYTIEHASGRKVEDLRISNFVFERAERGNPHFMTKICLQVRHKIEKDYGYDPGFVYYQDLELIKTRDVPASAKRPPKMKPASSALKNSHARSLTPRR